LVAALPVIALTDDPQWQEVSRNYRVKTHTYVGRDFVTTNGENFYSLLMLARLACIPFSVLGLIICFCWGRDMFGSNAGLLAATFWCFDPNILAHGSLITPDVAGTSLGCCACYNYGRWLRSPTWTQSLVAGGVLGFAVLSLFSLNVLIPLWLIMWVVGRVSDRATMRITDWLREWAMLMACFYAVLYILNIGYGFEGSMQRLNQFEFNSSLFTGKTTMEPGNRFRESWLGSIPMPVPSNYLAGIDQRRCDFEDYHRPSYLAGSWQKTGWWYYYYYALAIKVPVGTSVLVFAAFLIRLFRARSVRFLDEVVLLVPPLAILTVVSMQSGYSEDMRYVLPIFPYLFIWASQMMPSVSRRQGNSRISFVARTMQVGSVASLLVWMTASSMSVYPHTLAYFNELVGGPTQGHRFLLGSNIDWGQDLRHLKWYLDTNQKNNRCFLAYEGTVYPEDLGITYSIPQSAPNRQSTQSLPSGVYAISVTYLHGMPFISRGKGDQAKTEILRFDGFLDRQPTAMCGYSIYVYVVD